jgi:hypothetical protein
MKREPVLCEAPDYLYALLRSLSSTYATYTYYGNVAQINPGLIIYLYAPVVVFKFPSLNNWREPKSGSDASQLDVVVDRTSLMLLD